MNKIFRKYIKHIQNIYSQDGCFHSPAFWSDKKKRTAYKGKSFAYCPKTLPFISPFVS